MSETYWIFETEEGRPLHIRILFIFCFSLFLIESYDFKTKGIS